MKLKRGEEICEQLGEEVGGGKYDRNSLHACMHGILNELIKYYSKMRELIGNKLGVKTKLINTY